MERLPGNERDQTGDGVWVVGIGTTACARGPPGRLRMWWSVPIVSPWLATSAPLCGLASQEVDQCGEARVTAGE